jgi:UDP-N-acetylglucosamine--N-acetylmuramyl-(pentapeptide) pyrophosphoryl-undecaprenol N-acetylglucosamine transferase
MRIFLVGGGTGGHFYPLMGVADALYEHNPKPELYYMGPDTYDEEALTVRNIRFIYCPAGKLRRYFSVQNILDIFRSFFGLFVAVWQLFTYYPDVVFSKGGYTSVPILIAARLLMIPVVIHESDAIPGRSNLAARGYARYIGIAYDDAATYFDAKKTALVGIPLRPEVDRIENDPFTKLGVHNTKPLIFVTGGSLGAERLNDLVIRSLQTLLPTYQILHQTGAAHYESIRLSAKALLADSSLARDYYIQSFLTAEMFGAALDAASVVVTRAGSTTLMAIARHGVPAIVIPIPEDVSRDQTKNAYAYARTGAATVIEQKNLTEHLLAKEIETIMQNQDKRDQMRASATTFYIPDAANKIASILIKIGTEHGS